MKTFRQFLQESKQSQFDIAYSISRKAHATQKDLAGNPYMRHVDAIIKKVSRHGDDVKAIAALHDTVEDTGISFDDLKKAGIKDHIIKAVDAITKRKGESREAYYSRVKQNRLARIVKIADIENNADEKRLRKLPKDKADQLRAKYAKALSIIESSYLDEDEVLFYESTILERAAADIDTQPWRGGKFTGKSADALKKLYDEIIEFVTKVKKRLR